MSFFILENLILTLLEDRGTLKFKRAGIKDDRRETMPLNTQQLKNRAKIITGEEIDAEDEGITFSDRPFANVDKHLHKMKPPLVLSPEKLDAEKLKANKHLHATMKHENLHSIFFRLLKKFDIDFESSDVIIDDLFSKIDDKDLTTFTKFMGVLKKMCELSGVDEDEIDSVIGFDDQIAYLLSYLEDPSFRKQIMFRYAEMLYGKQKVPEDFFEEWKKFDVSLKRVWRQLQKTANDIEY